MTLYQVTLKFTHKTYIRNTPSEPHTIIAGIALRKCVFNLIGPDPDKNMQDNSSSMCAVLEEQKHKKPTQAAPIAGPDLAAMMLIGTRVVRGVDWKWGDQVKHVKDLIPF